MCSFHFVIRVTLLWFVCVVCSSAYAARSSRTDVVVDNLSDQVSVLGKWPQSSARNSYGRNSRYAKTGGELNRFVFNAHLSKPGLYRVEVWNPVHRSRINAVPHIVNHDRGNARVLVNQKAKQGQWVVLGEYSFSEVGKVEITDDGISSGLYIGADAVRFVYVGPSNALPVAVIDGPSLGMVGESVHFSGASSADSDGYIERYEWDFGNGNTARGVEVDAVFSDAGPYDITLTVSDNMGEDKSTFMSFEAMSLPNTSSIIVDDADINNVTRTGRWKVSSADSYYGEGSKYARSGRSRDAITFSPNILLAGVYQIDVWHPIHRSRTRNVAHTVRHHDGEETVYLDQQSQQNQWVSLGQYTLGIGKSNSVEVSDDGLRSRQSVGADAVRFTYLYGNDDGECLEDCEELVVPEIRLSEVSSKNSSFDDADGRSPDWFEIHNMGEDAVNLEGWTVTDDESEPSKWTFPSYSIEPGAYLPIWASDKDRFTVGFYRTLVNEGDTFTYLLPQGEVDINWISLGFDDSGWDLGASGFGYGDKDDATELPLGTTSIFARTTFSIDDLSHIEALWLDVDYDDGFVAYLNGTEIARENISEYRPAFDAMAEAEHEATMYQNLPPQRFDISNVIDLLNQGENILSIQAHNMSPSSSDFTLTPYLTARYTAKTYDGVEPPKHLWFDDYTMHTNFEISTGDESLFLYDADGILQDSIDVLSMITDKSIGMSEIDGSIVYFDKPTPGRENELDEYRGITLGEVEFSHDGGLFFESSVALSGAQDGEEIRYTLDATVPTLQSPLYETDIDINENTVIRARIFKEGFIPSRTVSRTYITGANHELPIVSLVTDPINFFGFQSGIYAHGPNYEDSNPHFGANFWQDWETEVNFSFYEPEGFLGIEIDAGAKVFGGWSRAFEHRSLSIFARGRYGFKKIKYPLFPRLNYEKFQAIVLRNSGNDWMRGMMRDITLTSLMDGSGLETQSYRSSAVYINGEYWGMYHMREKINEHFLASKHNVKVKNVDILEGKDTTVHGNRDEYDALVEFIADNDLSIQDNFDYVDQQIDIDNFIQYQVAQIYFDNEDWPGNNIKYWKSPQTKWRWILFDTDFGFGSNNASRDTLSIALSDSHSSWANPPWSTLFLRQLIENDGFRYRFINQFADDFNTRFAPDDVLHHIEDIALTIESELPNQMFRWQDFLFIDNWRGEVDFIKEFGRTRTDYLISYIQDYFGLSGMSTLNIINKEESQGQVYLNSLAIADDTWQGRYFNGVPVILRAVAAEGFVFSHWSGASDSTKSTITLEFDEDTQIEAVFLEDI